MVLAVVGARATEITGQAYNVVDGDTFDLAGETIRLCGVDAPERGDRGFREATVALADILADNQVRCRQVGDGTVCGGLRDLVEGHCAIARSSVEGCLASRAGLTPSPTCLPGQGGLPKGDAAVIGNETGRATCQPSSAKPMEGFSMRSHIKSSVEFGRPAGGARASGSGEELPAVGVRA